MSDELSECQYKTKLYYSLPFERGYLGKFVSKIFLNLFLVNWNTELEIWDRLFSKDLLDVKFDETRLLLTDPNCVIPAIKNIADEVVFETYQFSSLNMTAGNIDWFTFLNFEF